jgi:hypothetical protein
MSKKMCPEDSKHRIDVPQWQKDMPFRIVNFHKRFKPGMDDTQVSTAWERWSRTESKDHSQSPVSW